jgi:hypothetical protein
LVTPPLTTSVPAAVTVPALTRSTLIYPTSLAGSSSVPSLVNVAADVSGAILPASMVQVAPASFWLQAVVGQSRQVSVAVYRTRSGEDEHA